MRLAHALLLIAGICAHITTSQAAEAPATLFCSDGTAARRFDLRTDGRDLSFRAGSNAWIEIAESGQTVAVVGDRLDQVIGIPRPLRFGSHWVKVSPGAEFSLRRVYPGNGDGSVEVAVHCSPSADLQHRLKWLERAGRIVENADSMAESEQAAALLESAHALAEAAEGAVDSALAQHLIAQALVMTGREADAGEAFVAAESAWKRAGNENAALAARLGYVEGFVRTGEFQAALDSTQPPAKLRGSMTYLVVRTENARCIALQNLGQLDEAERCYGWTLSHFEQLREPAEYATALQSYASLKRDRGDFDAAKRIAEDSLKRMSGPFAPMVRGRNRLWLADLALRRGDVADAIQQLNGALQEFVAFRSARWQGNVYLKLADLYGELGSYDEAYSALAQAVQRFNPRDASPRLANAILSFAELEYGNGRPTSALCWSVIAETMFRRLNMPAPASDARLFAAAVQIDGAPALISDTAETESPLGRDSGKWRIVRTRLALTQGRFDDVRANLDHLSHMPLTLSDRVQMTVLLARLQAGEDNIAAAQTTLFEMAAHVRLLASRAGSDVLRYVIARQDQELRRAGLRITLQRDQATPAAIDVIWRWLATEADSNGRAADRRPEARSDAFDRAVAAELLVESNHPGTNLAQAREASQRELLSRLAGTDRAGAQALDATTLSLPQFQALLPDDSAFIAYVDGGTRGAMLWLTRDDARLLPAAAPEQVRADAASLQELAKNASTPLESIQVSAHQLSADLLSGVESKPPPRHLYVLADTMSRAIPWGLVSWTDRREALTETTAITMVRLAQESGSTDGRSGTPPAEIRVVVAAQREAAQSTLPVLAGAAVEPTEIRESTAGHGVRVVEDARARRETVDRALSTPGGWVHIAAHGVAEPQRIGYAGLWLESDAVGTPAFLSWIDVLDHGVRSDLVVLDACQTGDSGTAVNGNLSFADAVARAGARRVVAAMWPVSDVASATWVPAFYAALLADEKHDAADALRGAQQKLRATRAFAHPFYWAGMQAIERWPIGAAANH